MSRGTRYTLAFWGVLAMFAAYLLGFCALANPALAVRLENGALPPGADLSGDRIAAVSSVAAACSAVAAVFASRMILPILLALVACVPFVKMSVFMLLLTF
ncbi:hypothetical protein [Mycolicibacter minnesotensis]